MTARSWFHLTHRDPALVLPDDLRARDPERGVDVGWTEQMAPFVAAHSGPSDLVLDPFAGLGTTLLAAALQGRRALGIEIDPVRVELTRERLARYSGVSELAEVRQGDARHVTLEPCSVRLVLTSVPYFRARRREPREGDLYAAAEYAAYLELLSDVFRAVERALAPGGAIVAFAENLRDERGELVPLAWDTARLLAGRFVLREERIIVYDRKREGASDPFTTDRSHEYALVAEKRRERIDVREVRELLDGLMREGFSLAVFGSFARYVRGEPVQPTDLDVLAPRSELLGLLAALRRRGFELRVWGERLSVPIDEALLDGKKYVRARGSGSMQVDVTYEPAAAVLEGLAGRESVDGLPLVATEYARTAHLPRGG